MTRIRSWDQFINGRVPFDQADFVALSVCCAGWITFWWYGVYLAARGEL